MGREVSVFPLFSAVLSLSPWCPDLLTSRRTTITLTMDPEAFLEMANQVTKLKMYPYFDIAHCVICCLYVREDLGAGSLPFSRKHPLSNWLSSMISIFAGGLICNWLLGEPILGALKNNQQLMVATAVWYLIFYSPFDVGYKVCKFFPNGYVIMIAIGTIKGNGSGFIKILERLFRGTWTPAAMEVMAPSFPTKASIAAAIIFVLDKKTDLISAPHALVYFGICIFFAYFKLSSLLLGIHDPFIPFENLFCAIFLGGIWDSLQATLAGKKAAAAAPGDAAKNG